MHDIEIYRANRRVLDITVTDPPGTPIEVTGWTALFALRTNVIGAPNLLAFSSEDQPSQIVVGELDESTPPVASRVLVTLTETHTALDPGWYVWDVLMTDPDTGDYTVIAGALRILPTIAEEPPPT